MTTPPDDAPASHIDQTLAGCVVLVTADRRLEAFAGFCLGCWIFGRLQRAGLIPADVCEACNDISLRRPAATRAA